MHANGKAAIWPLNFLDIDSKDKYHCFMFGISIHWAQELCLLSETFSSTVMGNENNPKAWHLRNIPQMLPIDSDNYNSQCPGILQREMDPCILEFGDCSLLAVQFSNEKWWQEGWQREKVFLIVATHRQLEFKATRATSRFFLHSFSRAIHSK